MVGRAGLRGRSGAPFDSDLLLRMGRGDGMVMPPGSRRADLPGMGLIGDWIQSDPAK